MPNQDDGRKETAAGDEPPQTIVVPERGVPDGANTKREGEQKAEPTKDSFDRDLVRWTKVLAFFTGALVLGAGLQFWAMRGQLNEMRATREGGDKSFADQLAVMQAQAKAMQGQLSQMAISQRPWLKFTGIEDISIRRDTERGSDAAHFTITPAYKNIGQTPARGSLFAAHVIVLGAEPGPIEICNSDKAHREGFLAGIVFPQADAGGLRMTYRVELSDLESQAAQAEATLKLHAPPILNVVGCLTYRLPGSEEVHVTGFWGRLFLKGRFDRALSLEDLLSSHDPLPLDIDLNNTFGGTETFLAD